MKKSKKFLNTGLATLIFLALMGSAFAISFLFGFFFVMGFFIAAYKKEVMKKPWKPISIFVGALIIRYSLELTPEILASETILDLIVIFLFFLAILLLGWKVKKKW